MPVFLWINLMAWGKVIHMIQINRVKAVDYLWIVCGREDYVNLYLNRSIKKLKVKIENLKVQFII